MELGKTLMVFEFRLSLDDIVETARAAEPTPKRLGRSVIMALGSILVAALLIVPLIMKDVPDYLAAFFLGVLPFAVLIVVLPWYYSPARIHRLQYRAASFPTCRVEVAEGGIKEISELSEHFVLWKGLSSYAESKTQFVLSSGFIRYIVPKRAVDHTRLQELESLLRHNVKKGEQ